jgi:hypothetical protein
VIRLAIVVEGQTEEEFVNKVLASHLRTHGVEPKPILLGSGGGNITVERVASHMARLFWSFDRVTSMVDLYGFRDREQASREDLQQRIRSEVDRRIRSSYDQSRVFPYVQRYEFEGLLFSDVAVFGELEDAAADLVMKLSEIRSRFETPEDINDGEQTHPSRRIEDLMPSYHKRVHGSDLARSMGLATIRAECPGFDEWVGRLESRGHE